MAERSAVVRAVDGRRASVAVAVVQHPTFGESVVVSRRSSINGHTGQRMPNADEVVLLGGAIEPHETPADAAVREICEEAGTPHLLADGSCEVRDHLGTWTTEAGFEVEGFVVVLPSSFVGAAVADEREVAELAYLRVADVLDVPVTMEYHLVERADRVLEDPDGVLFESPTLRVRHPGSRQDWVLWGLAGFMVDRWRSRLSAHRRRAPAR